MAVGEAGLTAPPQTAPPRAVPLGGQAVLEGVMMRGVRHWAVAFRRPVDGGRQPGEIGLRCFAIAPMVQRHRLLRLPVLRGVVALAESLSLGLRALAIAAAAQVGQAEEELPAGVWAGTLALALAFAVALFFVAPVGLTSLIARRLGSPVAFWLVEGLVRTAIFLVYLLALSRLRDLRRLLEYHGAEHKAIACFEAGDRLDPERARLYPRLHPRCGTSFLLVVMVIAIFVFAPIGLHAWWILVLSRIAGVPVIVGLSFEAIRWAASHQANRVVRAITLPGLQLQRLTTREPDFDQLSVAIAALEAVLARETPGAAGELIGVELAA